MSSSRSLNFAAAGATRNLKSQSTSILRQVASSSSSPASPSTQSSNFVSDARRNFSSSCLRAAESTPTPLPVPKPTASKAQQPSVHLPTLARTKPDLYAAIRPPPLSAFASLAARIGLLPADLDAETRSRRIQLVYQACTHPSFPNLLDQVASQPENQESLSASGLVKRSQDPLDAAQYLPLTQLSSLHNGALSTLGNSLMGMFSTEFLHLRYPHLPTRVLKAAVSAYVGPNTLAQVGSELGLGGQGLLRWDRNAKVQTKVWESKASLTRAPTKTLLNKDVLAQAVRSLVGAIFQECGLSAARKFVINHFCSRNLPLAPLLKFQDPKKVLSSTCAKYDKEPPQSRMIAETGRLSISPVFVVGVWSGRTKLGEGSGSSIRMAEYRAAEDALRRLYLAEEPLGFDLPTSTMDRFFDGSSSSSSETLASAKATETSIEFRPQQLGSCEVLEGAGKQ
ncbi:ribonuclease III [Violaceomyces palustris]|uniref:Ribonuclease III n=1 Tax=Violaceomyces palustris TaxID=1673888 RepID=A0ACD0NRB8_9BASI|nr:ribonuclease III [Violaceomyces palustris]